MAKKRGALLWIDVPGLGSRVSAQPYAEGARMMRVFRAVLLPPCDAFGGRLASAVGDSFQIVFRRPTDAVLAAAAVQDRAALHARGNGEKPDMRACVVSGEMRVDRNGVIGDLVDLAARVRGAAGRGDVVLSGDVFAAMDKSRLTAEELDERRLGLVELVARHRARHVEHGDEIAAYRPRLGAAGREEEHEEPVFPQRLAGDEGHPHQVAGERQEQLEIPSRSRIRERELDAVVAAVRAQSTRR